MGINEESGLVFDETVKRRCGCLAKAYEEAKHNKPIHSPRRKHQQRARRGARPLKTVLEKWLLANLHRLGTDTLAGVPSLLVNHLWQSAKDDGKASLHLWTIFVRSGLLESGNEQFEWHYACSRCRRMPEVLQVLNDDRSKWLVDLKLDCHYLDKDDLYQLANLRNIRSLAIRSEGHVAATERVLHSWLETVKLNKAFPLLARMHITLPLSRYQRPGDKITKHALNGLQYYPALQHVCIEDPSGRLPERVESGDTFGTFTATSPRTCPGLSDIVTACGILQAFVGCRSSTLDLDDDRSERWNAAKVCLSRTAPGHAAAMLCNDHHKEPVKSSKKRKLKDGKSMLLGNVLQGL